jgi:hypothetical protein
VRQPIENPRSLGVEHGIVEHFIGLGEGDIAQGIRIRRQTRELGRASIAGRHMRERDLIGGFC